MGELKLQENQKDSEDPCKQMEYSGKSSEYTEDREILMRKFRQWMLESAYQIRANFVDPVYDQKRLRRVVDVINKIKVCLKATTPLGIETEDEEEDQRFLRFMTTNEELIDLGWKLQSEKQRVRDEEEERRGEKEGKEAGDLPPQHGYAAKLRKIAGR